jgi:hypothetical protein
MFLYDVLKNILVAVHQVELVNVKLFEALFDQIINAFSGQPGQIKLFGNIEEDEHSIFFEI